MKKQAFLKNNSLSIVALSIFLICWMGQAIAGFFDFNQEAQDHGFRTLTFIEYLRSGAFWEATFENWESEFLQMGIFVFLTAFLIQVGSAESQKPESEVRQLSKLGWKKEYLLPGEKPWAVRRGGWVRKLYESSLGLSLLLLFLISFMGHILSGARAYNHDQVLHGLAPVSTFEYFLSARFWFESLQNWQSEFLSVGAIVLLSIYLRQKNSPQSKPVEAPHIQTGSS